MVGRLLVGNTVGAAVGNDVGAALGVEKALIQDNNSHVSSAGG